LEVVMEARTAHESRSHAKRLVALVATGAAVVLALAAAARAADPGRWTGVGHTPVPLEYFQGVAPDPYGNLYFDGIFTGVFAARPVDVPAVGWRTVETARNENVIPPAVTAAEGYEHIGDPTWAPTRPDEDPAVAALLGDRGRLLLPLECFAVDGRLDDEVCPDGSQAGALPGELPSTGAIGVVDAASLTWQYYVKLDEGALRKAMWAELSPNGKLLWTQGGAGTERGEPGRDLLAFPAAAIAPANATTPGLGGPKLKPKVVLRGAVPPPDPRGDGKPTQITGATFFAGRLLLATQTRLPTGDADLFQVWSLDVDSCELVTGCDRRLEIERELVGESEGLATTCTFDGVLHWLVAPNNRNKAMPTFWASDGHVGQSTVMSFVPTSGAGVRKVCGT